MKRDDRKLNPSPSRKTATPRLVCGAPLDGGATCQMSVSGPHPCRLHGGPSGFDAGSLPDGLQIHKAFADEGKQAELERYVGSLLDEYQLNETADLRQIILSGVAYVRLLYDGPTMEPRDLDYLSRVVDRHLRNLRATPKEQAGPAGGPAADAGVLGAGVAIGSLMERVRLALSPAQLTRLAQGGPPDGRSAGRGASGSAGRAVEIQEAEELRPAAPDPFDD